MTPVSIDIYSDVVCPWCYVGSERLEQTLGELGLADSARVHYRPFLLHPDAPPGGVDIAARLRRQYGDLGALFARVESAARESGLDLDLSKQPMSYPTLAAHTLIRHAAARGTQRSLVRALFRAHFDEARNISDPDVLAAVAADHGFERDEAARLVCDADELAATRRDADAATARGITAVPFFLFDGRYGIPGAQSKAVLRAVIAKAQETSERPAGYRAGPAS